MVDFPHCRVQFKIPLFAPDLRTSICRSSGSNRSRVLANSTESTLLFFSEFFSPSSPGSYFSNVLIKHDPKYHTPTKNSGIAFAVYARMAMKQKEVSYISLACERNCLSLQTAPNLYRW